MADAPHEQQQQKPTEAVEHLKQALEEAAAEPGATIGKPGDPHAGEHGAPGVPLVPVAGAGGEGDEKKHLLVAPSAAGAVDVVEAVALPSGAEIRTDIAHGFGASAGPVRVEGGRKVVAHAGEEKEKKKEGPAAVAAGAEAPTEP